MADDDSLFVYRDDYSSVLKAPLSSSEDIASLPLELREPDTDYSPTTHLANPVPDANVNRFGVLAGQGLKEWEKSGWIWKGDPRGWMQWYIRFYEGRRCEDDHRQIMRCKSFELE